MKKKTIVFHSNFCRAFTGFGKNKKNILRYLYNTDKYNIIELANGLQWDDPQTKTVPWTCRGSMLPPNQMQSLNADEQRQEGYGRSLVDKAIKEFKPDVYIGIEDIWAFGGYAQKPWWNKINTMVWTTLDSLPILPQAVDFAPKVKNYYVWSSFAEKGFNKMGYNHVKTLRGSLDTSNFYRFSDSDRKSLREKLNLSNEYIVGFVFRNQLRKSVPNLLDGFKLFKKIEPKAKLFLHTHWSEGWDIPRLLEEKQINSNDILTTYVCSNCDSYMVGKFNGQELNCQKCGAQKSVNTTNTNKGVTEKQLNEIYNLMDVYCHPFTSGGQEIPIQEAKLTELISLVTNYSCGEDSCSEESGGLPLTWSEYREPGTQFMKASTSPESIFENLKKVHAMPEIEKQKLGQKSRQWVIDNFSIEVIGKKLEKIIDEMPEIEYDFNLKKSFLNPNYTPKQNYASPKEFLIDIYKNILNEDVDENDTGFKNWHGKIQAGGQPQEVVNFFKNTAQQQIDKLSAPELTDILDNEGKEKRIAVVMPQSDIDVFFLNCLLKNLKKLYKQHNLYVFTEPRFFSCIDDNPYIHKLLPYTPILEDTLSMEGCSQHEGYFDMVFNPNCTTQKNLAYLHNGKDKIQFSLV
tara:strand:- start:2740 stop:4629 length:1890 start_codon:yes stop_codon:yes gene_type:complete